TGSTLRGTAAADGSGSWTITITSTLTSGTYSITATATDAAGNVSPASGALSVTIDTGGNAPSPPDLTAASDTGSSNTDNLTSNSTPPFTGSAPTRRSSELTGSTLRATAAADGGGSWTITITSTLSDGPHSITATATDAAGNVSPVSGALS